MSDDRVSEGLRRALDLPESEWPGFLDSFCGQDPDTRAHIERLLQRYQQMGLNMGPGVGISTAAPPPRPTGQRGAEQKVAFAVLTLLAAAAAWWFAAR
jgi:ferric-dicitrate binding protein FerR (iron transport regulator)